MLVLGVDDALLWAVGAFFLSFVPYLGLVLALIPPTILAFAESGPAAAAAVVIGGTALNLIAENVLEPTLTGRALSLSTWLVFIDVLLLGLAHRAGRGAAVDADHGAGRARPPAQRADAVVAALLAREQADAEPGPGEPRQSRAAITRRRLPSRLWP